MNFHPRIAIKGQALADFIVKFTYADPVEVARTVDNVEAAKVVEVQGERNSVPTKWDMVQWTF